MASDITPLVVAKCVGKYRDGQFGNQYLNSKKECSFANLTEQAKNNRILNLKKIKKDSFLSDILVLKLKCRSEDVGMSDKKCASGMKTLVWAWDGSNG